MKSSFSSCFTTLILAIVAAALVRFALPGVWHVLAMLLTGTLVLGFLVFFAALRVVGFFIYRNVKRNKDKQETEKYAKGSLTVELYRSCVGRLQQNIVFNQVTS